MPACTFIARKKIKKYNVKVKKIIILLMAGLMIMPACRSSRLPELLQEQNNYSLSLYLPEESLSSQPATEESTPPETLYVPEESLSFQLALFFGFCTIFCCFVSFTKLQLDDQEWFREQMKNYVNEKKQYDLKFLRSRYANGIIKSRFNGYSPCCPKPIFDNSTKIIYCYLLKYPSVVLMSMFSCALANPIPF
jgi:hypothetical protein